MLPNSGVKLGVDFVSWTFSLNESDNKRESQIPGDAEEILSGYHTLTLSPIDPGIVFEKNSDRFRRFTTLLSLWLGISLPSTIDNFTLSSVPLILSFGCRYNTF